MHIGATTSAVETIEMVRARGKTDLTMVLSNGCCDSSSPFLFDNFLPDSTAKQVGQIAGVPVMAPAWLVALYPSDDDRFLIDVVEQTADDALSLETDMDRRFVLRAAPAPARARLPTA